MVTWHSPAPRTCLLAWLTNVPSRTLSAPAHTLRQIDPPPRPKQDLEQLVASSEAMKKASWRDWSNLLHGLTTAGMQCSSSPDLTWLCDQAVQLLPEKLARGAASQDISMTLWAMAKSGYTGSAQPLLQSVTAAINQGGVMADARPQAWANLIWAASTLPGCREEARQLLSQFAIRVQAVVPGLDAQNVSNILYAMGLVLWHDKEVCRQLAERAAQAVSSGHSQLASEPQLNSMAAALDFSRLVQALAAAGHIEVQQAVISQDGTGCTQLLVRASLPEAEAWRQLLQAEG
ncbi:hypothetical protein HaLaN_03392 [Haematococcus lacustris]|uniref:RAP domain-containing protein n=1 Tax=Haematococcus lacustris TaxID=44745 RepID=A0A699YG47_HAELA|nr:hypothetical protein HaLaN_03392 [Haematococcus lacustris]